MRRHLFAAMVMWAFTAPASMAQYDEPTEFMRVVVDDIVEQISTQRAQLQSDPEKLRALIMQGILPHVDFVYVSQLVLGKYWRAATPVQREAFMVEFREMLMRTYAEALLTYEDQQIRYLPTRNDPSRPDARVRTEIVPTQGEPIPVEYRVYKTKAGEWKVFDVSVERISIVTNYRNTFANEIRKHTDPQRGVQALIEKLKTQSEPIELNRETS
ncbi:MAG: ABC transporter substrate-binding protein [Pseudomonadota bacterium]|nr:ABC transporter substrate-binding protein [Pseudomonadota bacterium]